jgi:Tol biopolymer transport system component
LIAVEAKEGLYMSTPAAAGAASLAGTRAGDGDPRWSPDGRKLAFGGDAATTGTST